jgi:hypothetical protein
MSLYYHKQKKFEYLYCILKNTFCHFISICKAQHFSWCWIPLIIHAVVASLRCPIYHQWWSPCLTINHQWWSPCLTINHQWWSPCLNFIKNLLYPLKMICTKLILPHHYKSRFCFNCNFNFQGPSYVSNLKETIIKIFNSFKIWLLFRNL